MFTAPLPGDFLVPIFRDLRDMLVLTWAGVRAPSGAALATAAALGRDIHKTERELTERLVADSDGAAPLRLVPAHVECIADALDGLVCACQLMESEGATLTARWMREVNVLFERAIELLDCEGDLTLAANRALARHVEVESRRFQRLAAEYARAHEERMGESLCHPASSNAYLAILDYLREVTRHCRLIACRLAPGSASGEGSS